MQQHVAKSTKNVIVLAHTSDVMTEVGVEVVAETMVKVKGSLMNQGIESYFSSVISTKKIDLKNLKENDVTLMTEVDESTTGPANFMVTDPDGNVILIDQHV